MAILFTTIYLLFFAVAVGTTYALMNINLRRRPLRSSHPEAPKPGEMLLYVDLSRERLEQLYNKT
ncbi:MAG: hypothetical protein EBU30_02460 [Synechococcaceae bacterium WB6_3B_236]|jgi:hypothetical protein|nr:hypothetical protein [Synechococcaceae bacterium WB6_3B_236]